MNATLVRNYNNYLPLQSSSNEDKTSNLLSEKVQAIFQNKAFVIGCMALAASGIALCSGAVPLAVGSVAFAVASFVYARFQQQSTHDKVQLLHTLISTAPPHVASLAKKIEAIADSAVLKFPQSIDYYGFHCDLAKMSDLVRTDSKMRTIWDSFLQKLNGSLVQYASGITLRLNAKPHIERAHSIFRFPPTSSFLHPNAPDLNSVLKEIEAISLECFGDSYGCSPDILKKLINSAYGKVIVTRDGQTGRVLGFMVYRVEGDLTQRHLHITALGRRAEAAKIQIGEKLFAQFYNQNLSSFQSVFLEVRESNKAAQALYRSQGFNFESINHNYYSAPREHGFLMRLNNPQAHAIVA